MRGNRWTEVVAPMIRAVKTWNERMIGERRESVPITNAGVQIKAVGHVQIHHLIHAIRREILHPLHVSKLSRESRKKGTHILSSRRKTRHMAERNVRYWRCLKTKESFPIINAGVQIVALGRHSVYCS
jgi:hypothetical protein